MNFGEGGGFTGNYTSCLFDVSGQVECLNGDKYELNKKEIKKIISLSESINCSHLNNPGNYSYQIIINKTNDTLIYSWSIETEPCDEVKELYDLLRKK